MPIVFIQTSELSACALGCYGEQRTATPSFDALAAQSLVCNHFYATAWEIGQSSADQVIVINLGIPELDRESLQTAAESWLGEVADQCPGLEGSPPHPQPLSPEYRGEGSSEEQQFVEQLPVEFRHLIVAAARAIALDDALASTLDEIELDPDSDVVIVAGVSGDAGRVPDERPDWLAAVSEPVVHLPLLIHIVGQEQHVRIDELVGVDDLQRLIEMLKNEGPAAVEAWRDSLVHNELRLDSPLSKAVRTQKWLLVEKKNDPDEASAMREVRLFRKPEDVWEMLDVASQFPELIDHYLETGELPADVPFVQHASTEEP
ncbi:alkaline phosphatase family protein [Planctomicrobium piriforme]|uniref:Uncharacterized protein n=1 Tax=Planctomicrobium piriforme TaxID=1576369 RepID=A0A1I3DN08_9PLAN|nr:hypothetical protein [Planctomicrobium piriforme]SFH87938.1 hypothetical protein SAMN05421753_103324 [Planctomicrobium piriforme]